MERKELVKRLEDAFLMDASDEWEESTDLLNAWVIDNPDCDYGDDCFNTSLLMLFKIVETWHAYIFPMCETKREIASSWYNESYCFLLNEMKLSA